MNTKVKIFELRAGDYLYGLTQTLGFVTYRIICIDRHMGIDMVDLELSGQGPSVGEYRVQVSCREDTVLLMLAGTIYFDKMHILYLTGSLSVLYDNAACIVQCIQDVGYRALSSGWVSADRRVTTPDSLEVVCGYDEGAYRRALAAGINFGGATGDSGPYLQLEVNCARNLYFRLGSDGRVYMVDATAFESRQDALAKEMSRSWSYASPDSYL